MKHTKTVLLILSTILLTASFKDLMQSIEIDNFKMFHPDAIGTWVKRYSLLMTVSSFTLGVLLSDILTRKGE
jgi:hypothetical protein